MSRKKIKIFSHYEGRWECPPHLLDTVKEYGYNGNNWSESSNIHSIDYNRIFSSLLKISAFMAVLVAYVFVTSIIFRPEWLSVNLKIAVWLLIFIILPLLSTIFYFVPIITKSRNISDLYIVDETLPFSSISFIGRLLAINLFIRVHFIIRFPKQAKPLEFSGVEYCRINCLYLFLSLFNKALLPCLRLLLSSCWRPSKAVSGNPAPLKVMHNTCSFDWGGTQRQIINLCTYGSGRRMIHIPNEIFAQNNKMFRTNLPSRDLTEYLASGFPDKFISLFLILEGPLCYSTMQILKLYSDFKQAKPDVVVGWGHEVCVYTYMAAALAKVPHVVFCIRTVNPNYYESEQEKILRRFHRKVKSRLSATIVNSSFLRTDHSDWLKNGQSDIHVCHNGIVLKDEARILGKKDGNVRARLGIPQDQIMILNVGRFSPEKGQLIMVQAAELLQAKFSNLHYILCGNGPTLPEIKYYMEERKVRNVHLVGAVSDPDDYYAAADMFLMPSDFEGLPNAMMEAMNWGLPCISTTLSGATDLADDGKEALFVPPRNSEALAEKIEYLVNNPEKRKEIGENAAKRIKAFSVDNMISRFNEIIENSVMRENHCD